MSVLEALVKLAGYSVANCFAIPFRIAKDVAGWVGLAICLVALIVAVLLVGICLRPHADLTLRE